jgi:hypothetical protein
VLANPHTCPEDYPLPVVAAIRLAVRHMAAQSESDAITVLRRASVVFADQIPSVLLELNPVRFSDAMLVLSQMSLLRRWQDHYDID